MLSIARPSSAAQASTTPANKGLVYDAAADQYVYVWKTSRAMGGMCVEFVLRLDEGEEHSFNVHFTR